VAGVSPCCPLCHFDAAGVLAVADVLANQPPNGCLRPVPAGASIPVVTIISQLQPVHRPAAADVLAVACVLSVVGYLAYLLLLGRPRFCLLPSSVVANIQKVS
jgi:hypothetical protein